MSDYELEKKIHIAGTVGCAVGFVCGAGLMTMVAIIF